MIIIHHAIIIIIIDHDFTKSQGANNNVRMKPQSDKKRDIIAQYYCFYVINNIYVKNCSV